MTLRTERIQELLKSLAAQFLERESDRTTLITVTRVTASKDLKRASIFFTVYPENKENYALLFAKRHVGDFRDYIKKNASLKRIPFFDFIIDEGEKNRQRIDELSRN